MRSYPAGNQWDHSHRSGDRLAVDEGSCRSEDVFEPAFAYGVGWGVVVELWVEADEPGSCDVVGVGVGVDDDLEHLVGKPESGFNVVARFASTSGIFTDGLGVGEASDVGGQFLSEDILERFCDVREGQTGGP